MTQANDPIKEQLQAARTNQILDAAIRVFAERGYHRATIRAVAQAAGVADGTIYNYFANKEALLIGILERLNQSAQRRSDFAAGAQGDARAFFTSYMRQRLQLLQADPALMQALLPEVLANAELRAIYREQIVAPTFEIATTFLQELMERGTLRALDPALMARLLAALTLGTVMLHVIGDDVLEARLAELPTAIVDLLWHGLAQGNNDDEPTAPAGSAGPDV